MYLSAFNLKESDYDHLVDQIKINEYFRDFFNKFCCLPIFGQRVAFHQSGNHLLLDPLLEDKTGRLSDQKQDYILRWFLSQRYELFNQSRFGCEFKLFLSLRMFQFTGENLCLHFKVIYIVLKVFDLSL